MMHDVVGASGLAIFAEVGLVIFLLVFVVAVVRIWRRPKADYDAIARIPLDEHEELHDRRRSEA